MAFATVAIIGASVAAAGGIAKLGMSLAGRKSRIEEQKKAKEEMQRRMAEYENLDTSNLNANVRNQFANMENTYEDITINQQQAQFIAQQGQQQRANIMGQMRGAAGGSGIAALAQAMARQGQLATQQAGASIGLQEAKIQQLQAGEASRLQTLGRKGEQYAEAMRLKGAETARGLDWSKTGTLLGMSQQRVGAANQARAQARAQQLSAVGDIVKAGTQMATAGMKMNAKVPGTDTVSTSLPGTSSTFDSSNIDLSQGGLTTNQSAFYNPSNPLDDITYTPNSLTPNAFNDIYGPKFNI